MAGLGYHPQLWLSVALIVAVCTLFHTNTDLPPSYEVGAVFSKLQYIAVYGTYF